MKTGDKPYILATGERAVSRLNLLERIFGNGTRDLLSVAGVGPAMRVAEIGCGIGLTAQWISGKVGPSGSVVAVDSSSEQLEIASRRAAEAGIKNLSFHKGDAYESGLTRDSFDLVYARFLLCHVADPARALTEMRSLLKPGGTVVESLNRTLVEMPAWRHLGAQAWATFSRSADLGNGTILYPLAGIGGLVLILAAAVVFRTSPQRPWSVAILLYGAALLAICGILTTRVELHRIGDDPRALQQAFEG